MKSISIQLATVFLLLCLFGCVATESPATSREMSSESIRNTSSMEASSETEMQIDPTETKQIVQSLVADYEKVLFIYPEFFHAVVYAPPEYEYMLDKKVNHPILIDGVEYFKVENEEYRTINDIKVKLEKVYTKEFLEKWFYSQLLDSPINPDPQNFIPLYREYEGCLYVPMTQGGPPLEFPQIDTIQVQEVTPSKIVFLADLRAYSDPTIKVQFELSKTAVGWRISECVYPSVEENDVP